MYSIIKKMKNMYDVIILLRQKVKVFSNVILIFLNACCTFIFTDLYLIDDDRDQ